MLGGVGLVGRVGQGRFGRGGVIIPPPLDTVTGSAAAYSLRRIRTAYAGSAIRVRRSNDNAELDIGFSGNVLNTAALLTHCGANSGFITTWYDQSGNTRNMIQATAGAQPRIVNAGTIDVFNGLPIIVCDTTDDVMAAATWGTIAQPFSRNMVVRMAASLTAKHVMNTATGAPNVADFINSGVDFTAFAGTTGPSVTVSANEMLIYTSIYDGASSVVAKNGALSAAGSVGSNSSAGISINRNDTGSTFGGFSYQEIVLLDSRVSTSDRQFLERNQGAYYGITVA
jgi:hypothetical protein